jgi:hypothetical protein
MGDRGNRPGDPLGRRRRLGALAVRVPPETGSVGALLVYGSFLGGVETGVQNDASEFAIFVVVALLAFAAFWGLRAWAAEVGTGWGVIGILAVLFLCGIFLWWAGHPVAGPILALIAVVLILAAGARGKQRRDG